MKQVEFDRYVTVEDIGADYTTWLVLNFDQCLSLPCTGHISILMFRRRHRLGRCRMK